MIKAPGNCPATARALASASRNAVSAGDSLARGVSSISGDAALKGSPSRSSNSLRKREPEARTSGVSEVVVSMVFFDMTARIPYYATFDLAAGAGPLATNREAVHRPTSALSFRRVQAQRRQ